MWSRFGALSRASSGHHAATRTAVAASAAPLHAAVAMQRRATGSWSLAAAAGAAAAAAQPPRRAAPLMQARPSYTAPGQRLAAATAVPSASRAQQFRRSLYALADHLPKPPPLDIEPPTAATANAGATTAATAAAPAVVSVWTSPVAGQFGGIPPDPPKPWLPSPPLTRRALATAYEAALVVCTLNGAGVVVSTLYPLLVPVVGHANALFAMSPLMTGSASVLYALAPNLCPDPRFPLSTTPRVADTYRALRDRWAAANRARVAAFYDAIPLPTVTSVLPPAPAGFGVGAQTTERPAAIAARQQHEALARRAAVVEQHLVRAVQATSPSDPKRTVKSVWLLFVALMAATLVLQTLMVFVRERFFAPPDTDTDSGTAQQQRPTEEPAIIEQLLVGGWWPACVVTVLAPFCEELFFRGFVFRRLYTAAGWVPAYVANSAVFGYMHASDESDKVLETGAFGAILALAYRLSGMRLWVPVALHGLSNGLVSLGVGCLSPALSHEQRTRALRALFRMRRPLATFEHDVCLWLNGAGVPLLPEPLLQRHAAELSPEFVAVVDSVFDRYADALDPNTVPAVSGNRSSSSAALSQAQHHVLSVGQLARLLVQHHPTVRLMLACVHDRDGATTTTNPGGTTTTTTAPCPDCTTHAHPHGAPTPALRALVSAEMDAYRASVPSFANHKSPTTTDRFATASVAASHRTAPRDPCYSAAWMALDIANALYDVEVAQTRTALTHALLRDDHDQLRAFKERHKLAAAKATAATAAGGSTGVDSEMSIGLAVAAPDARVLRRGEFQRVMAVAMFDSPTDMFKMLRSLGWNRQLQRVPPLAPPKPISNKLDAAFAAIAAAPTGPPVTPASTPNSASV